MAKLVTTPEQRAVFDRIEQRIEATPCDGINAAGKYSENVHIEQKMFIAGMRSARLAAINALKELRQP